MSNGIIQGNILASGVITISLTPTAVTTITAPEQTFTVPGLQSGDFVYVNPPSVTAGVGIVGARVSAANTLAIQFVNPTAGDLTPAAGSFLVQYIRTDVTLGRLQT